ncbi:hypothetical protein FRB90_005387 [Tulasnella sp. 427]|nr:hypothetical protein FRB90_005387 [Tulasnella sp. 427]
MAKAYSARFSILGGIGIFGGGATFGPIFNSDKRSFYDIIAISSICFTLATVLAVAGGLVAGVKPSKKVHDLNWVHGWLVFFALTSAALVFGGIVLLGVALISYKKTDAMVIGGGIHIAVAGVVLGVALSVVALGLTPAEQLASTNIVKGYNNRFGILAAIAFFGAGATFGSVFQLKDDQSSLRDIMAWSTTCFTLGTILSGAGGTVSGVGDIIHGTVEHRWLQSFAMISAIFIFTGIILLGVALIVFNASPAILAAGVVLVSLSFAFVVLALCMARCMVLDRRRRAALGAEGKRKDA